MFALSTIRTQVAVLVLTVGLSVGGSFADVGVDLLQPGNDVLIVVPDPKPTEQTVRIDEEGYLPLGRYGRIRVVGLSGRDALSAVRSFLSRYIVNTSAISLVRTDPKFYVFVTGMVSKSGFVRVGARHTAWQAIQAAGGATTGADLSHVVSVVEGVEAEIDIGAFLSREQTVPLAPMVPGQTVFVPADPTRPGPDGARALLTQRSLAGKVFVMGAVKQPGLYPYSDALNVLTALGIAGGTTPDADLTGVRVITPERSFAVNITGAMRDTRPQLQTLPAETGLIVYVPSRLQDGPAIEGATANVVGGVVRPGRVSLPGPTRLVDAIALAGGPTERADLEEVRLVRSGPGYAISTMYDVESFFEDGGVVGQVEVRPGDTVIVGAFAYEVFDAVVRTVSNVAIIAAAIVIFSGITK